jgi:hypothetical protein
MRKRIRACLLVIAALSLVQGALAVPQDELLLYRFDGDVASAQQGFSVAGAGDVDGDGIGDVIVGRVIIDPFGGGNFIKALVFSGADGALLFTVGELAPGETRNPVDGLGDRDGDGRSEVIVGTPGAFVTVGADEEMRGLVQIALGSDGAVKFAISGAVEGELFGASVAGVGDLDGDAIPDFVVGAPRADFLHGRVSAYSGDSGELIWEFSGPLKGDQVGVSVASLGDVTKDGHAEVVVGAPFVQRGSGAVIVLDGATGKALYGLQARRHGEFFGFSVAGVGDIDGDDAPDLIVGAPGGAAGPPPMPGIAYVFSGVKVGDLFFALSNGVSGDLFGLAVAGVGDFDGDGRPDPLVGAPQANKLAGSAFVYSGATASLLFRFNGEKAGDLFGTSVDGLGDITGDGFPELVIGAPGTSQATPPLFAAGSAFVFSSRPVAKPRIAVSPAALNFGAVPAGKLAVLPLTVVNQGSADLVVTDVSLISGSSSDFSFDLPAALPLFVPPGGSEALKVVYQPAGLGLAGGALDIRSNDADAALVPVPLSGRSIAPEIEITPPSVDFGSVRLRRSTTTVVRVLNAGTGDLVVSEISLDPDSDPNFTISAGPAIPAVIGPGGSTQVLVTYCPLNGDILEQGTVLIVSNDTDEPLVKVTLSGRGQ